MRAYKILILISCVIYMHGCSKITEEQNIYNPVANATAALPEAAFLNGTPDTIAFATTAPPSITPVVVNVVKLALETTTALPYNVTLTVAANPGLLPAGFTPLPPGAMTFSNTIVIPAGITNATLLVTLTNTSLLTLGTTYGYGLTITGASNGVGINPDKKNLLVKLRIQNECEGVYTVMSGNVTRYTAPGVPSGDVLSGPLAGNPTVILNTVDANTVIIPRAGFPGTLYWSGGLGGVAGIDQVYITRNPVTQFTTAISSSNTTFANWAGQPNYYDPATKTFYLAWRWNPASTVREYTIVLKYFGPL